MRLITLLIFVFLPGLSLAQTGLRYIQLNWNITGRFDAPNFSQYLQSYNLNGPKPPGVANYGFKIRGADAFSFMTGIGSRKGRAFFTLSYVGGSAKIDRFGDAPAPEWRKSLYYNYDNVGAGLMLHLLKSRNRNSGGLPRIEYQLGFDREFNRLRYADKAGSDNQYKTNNFGASTFIQYNFYAPYLGGPPVRVVMGINLRYHTSLKPIDFSALQSDLNFPSGNDLSDRLGDLTLGVTLGFLNYNGSKKVTNKRKADDRVLPTNADINAFEKNPTNMLQLSAVDSTTAEPLVAKYEVLDESKKRPVVLLGDKYLAPSVFKEMLTVYVTARAKGYFVREVAVHGYDTIKDVQEIRLREIPASPVGVFYFEQSTAKMSDDYASRIDSVVSVLQRNGHMNVDVVGHTSADGSSRLNRTLSLKRARVIRKLLLKRGVDEARIEVSGVGSAQPTVAGEAATDQSVNRRVEVFLRD